MSRSRILVSGGTGFLGRRVVPLLRKDFDVDVISRSSGGDICADLSRWDSGIESFKGLEGKYQGFLHMAGLYDLRASQVACHVQNIVGTHQALNLCQKMQIPVFINTSSVAATINSTRSHVGPDDLELLTTFPDAYSESKARAERMIQNWQGVPRLRVNLRPGVLVGDLKSGSIDRVDGPYYAAQAMTRLRTLLENYPGQLLLPGRSGRRLPLVPVDQCAQAMATITQHSLNSSDQGYVSHQLVPREGLEVGKYYESVMKHLLIRHHGVRLVHQLPQPVLKKISKWIMGFPEAQLTYLLNFPTYDGASTRAIVGEDWCSEFPEYERSFWSGYEKYISNR